MGEISYKRIVILISCLVVVSLLVNWHRPSKATSKNSTLREHLVNIGDWNNDGPMELDPRIVKNLELDDYVNENYRRGKSIVSVYIGYYLTTGKVGAAHDPMVCFPGQGWVVSEATEGELVLDRKGDASVSYSAMVAERGEHKELIIYWFQSFDRTNRNTFRQKVASLWCKVSRGREDNASVRISTPFGGKTLQECRETIFEFIRVFYPFFLNYVKNG